MACATSPAWIGWRSPVPSRTIGKTPKRCTKSAIALTLASRPGDPPGFAEPLHFLFGAPQPLRQIPLVRIGTFRLEEHAGCTEGDQPVSAVDVRDESRQCGDRSEGEQDRGGGNPQAFLAGHTAPGKARRGFVWSRFRTAAETQPLKPSAGQALREMAANQAGCAENHGEALPAHPVVRIRRHATRAVRSGRNEAAIAPP